jgi:predicted phosphodiesterase
MFTPVVRSLAIVACLLVLVTAALVALGPRGSSEGPVGHWVFDKEGIRGKQVADRAGKLPGWITGEVVFTGAEPTTALETHDLPAGVLLRDPVKAGDPVLPRRDLTVLAWVRIDHPTRRSGILSATGDHGAGPRGFVLAAGERASFGLATAGADGTGQWSSVDGKTAFEKGKWYHVAATWDGRLVRLYVNGKLDGSTELAGQLLPAKSAPLIIGAYREEEQQIPLRGAVREVALCHRALDTEEIVQQFDARRKLATASPAAERPYFVIAPYLQFATRTSITVVWETTLPGSSVVRYGVGGLKDTATGPKDVTLHEVHLTGLKPQTGYVYQVSTTDASGQTLTGPLLTFQTAVNPDSAYSFVLIGDTQKNPAVTGKLARLAWARRPNFVVHLGDVVDNGPDKKEWVDELFGPCAELFGRVPVYPTIGNHEKNHANYYRYFSLPGPKYHYRYRYGNADFFVIDSNKLLSPESEQYQWLDRELPRSEATWKFVYHHHPPYSSDDDDYGNTWTGQRSTEGDRNVRQLVALYERHNVDVVFNGHVHVYERTWPIRGGKVDLEKGIVYLTSGGGGGKLENFGPVPTWFKAQTRADFHYCYATIQGGRLSVRAFDHRDMLFDVFEIDK